MGWPLRFGAKYREFGGSFIYPMGEDKVSLGFVVGLDYRTRTFSVHDVLQEFKMHPMIRQILEGGKRVAWGAKTIPSGGYWAHAQAALGARAWSIAGDSAGHGQHAEAEGRPPARCTPACTRPRRSTSALKPSGNADDLSDYQGHRGLA